MDRKEVYVKLDRIFQGVFDDDTITVSDTTTAEDIEDWDSLEQINLIVAVEKEFNIKFSIREAGQFQNVGQMVDMILQKTPH